jgi:CreA protein
MEKGVVRITIIILLACFVFASWSISNANGADVTLTELGKVTIPRMMKDDKIQLLRFTDPDNPFIAIFFTRIKSGQIMAMSNPSNTAIATRLIAPIPVDGDGKQIVDKSFDEDLVSLPQSVMSKEMKIARLYDKKMNTLCYVVYSTKWMDGSLKHSLSVVPLR